MQNLDEMLELAKMLQNSNVPEVSKLAKSFLALDVSYKELRHQYIKITGEKIMRTHARLFKRLRESGD